MEISEQQVRRAEEKRAIGGRNLGKSTGEPIREEDTSNNNNNSESESVHSKSKQVNEQQRGDKKKLGQIRSFFNKSLKLSSVEKQQQIDSENDSFDRAEINGGEFSSSDEWHLLEPEEDEDSDQGQGFSVKSIRISERKLLSTAASESDKMFSKSKSPSRFNVNNNNNCYEDEPQYVDVDPLAEHKNLSPRLIRLCTALYALIPLASVCASFTFVFILFTRLWPITIIYYTLVFINRQTCNKGGSRSDYCYNSKFWTYLAAYFPIKLRHTQNFQLDPKENYILNYHPHGIAAFGCVVSFATNGLNFAQLFPGICSRFMVHETTFCVPLMREIFSSRGDCSVNSKSFDFILEKRYKQPEVAQATGNLLALCGGGLAEADLSNAETLKLVLAKRKGFVRKALIHGANLIPCIAFGENSVFTKVDLKPNSLLHKLETKWYNVMKFKHPIYYGASIVSNKIRGLMPYSRPITVVMGDPIRVRERVAEPTQQQVDQLHQVYMDQLQSLYRANSDLCMKYDSRLEIV